MIFFLLFTFCFFIFAAASLILIFYLFIPAFSKKGISSNSLLETEFDLFLLYENETVQPQKTFLESLEFSTQFPVTNDYGTDWDSLYKSIEQTMQPFEQKAQRRKAVERKN